MHFLIKDIPPQNLQILKLIAGLLAVTALIELVGYSRSFALSQLAMFLFFGVSSCYLFLYYSKKTFVTRAFLKQKKQETFAYELLIPLLIGCVTIICSAVLLLLIVPHKTIHLNAPIMLAFTLASTVLFLFTLFKLIHSSHSPKYTVAFGFKVLVLTIPLLLSLGAASSALYNGSRVLDYLATIIIASYVAVISFSICLQVLKFLISRPTTKLDLIQMLADLQAFEEVVSVKKLHAWTITSNLFGIRCEIVISHTHQPQQIIDQITDYIVQKYTIEHIIFEVTNNHLGDYYDV